MSGATPGLRTKTRSLTCWVTFSKQKATGVAQLVSALDTIIPEVAGSSPVTGPFLNVCFSWKLPAHVVRHSGFFKQVLSSARQSAGLQNQRSHVRSVQGLLTDYSILSTFASFLPIILFFLSSSCPAATALQVSTRHHGRRGTVVGVLERSYFAIAFTLRGVSKNNCGSTPLRATRLTIFFCI